jgi:hypothetical protein
MRENRTAPSQAWVELRRAARRLVLALLDLETLVGVEAVALQVIEAHSHIRDVRQYHVLLVDDLREVMRLVVVDAKS